MTKRLELLGLFVNLLVTDFFIISCFYWVNSHVRDVSDKDYHIFGSFWKYVGDITMIHILVTSRHNLKNLKVVYGQSNAIFIDVTVVVYLFSN